MSPGTEPSRPHSLAPSRRSPPPDSLLSQTVVDAEFVSELLHKFSQPLTALRGFLELALEFSTTPEEYRQGIEEAMEQADRMIRLKQVLTELSGRHDLNAGAQRAEVSGLLVDAMADSLPVAERLGVQVETSCPVPLHAVVSVARMTQALSQLLNAALEYSPSRSTVLVSCLSSEGDAIVTYANGCGAIPEVDLRRVFEPFFVSRARSSGDDSSVWLALARKVVEASGGAVRLENTQPAGFRFLIRLPLAATRESSQTSTA
jgi:signal transduction histidine kinase